MPSTRARTTGSRLPTPRRGRSEGASAPSTPSAAPRTRVRDRTQFDLMLLAVVAQEPGDGYAVAATLTEQTRGRVMVSSRVVFTSLHRLTRNRLVNRKAGVYVLTDSGTRSLAAKRREWRALQVAMQAVLDRIG
jgi:DNA-binding PadR family transcriptional regulator